MYAQLPSVELAIYFFSWLGLFAKMVFSFYQYCRVLEKNTIFSNWALEPGFFLNYPYREKLDSDILVMYEHGVAFIVLGIGHVIIRQLLFGLFIRNGHKFRESLLLIFLAGYGLYGYGYIVGPHLAAFFLVLAVINWILVQLVLSVLPFTRHWSPLCRAWVVAVLQTLALHFIMDYLDGYQPNRNSQIAFVWSLGWYQLRLISYTDFNARYKTGFLHYIGYCFYFPTVFAPFVSFTRFVVYNDLRHADEENCPKRADLALPFGATLLSLVKQYLLISVWAGFTFFANHAFFPTALAFYQQVYLQSNTWTRAGHAWMMGQWFQSKYMLLYGAPWVVTLLDTGIQLPGIPVFISRVYRYSVMWRRFDTGLYEFMRDHLYGPSLAVMDEFSEKSSGYFVFYRSKTFRRVFALAITYGFVGIWHGLSSGVLLFAAMNYIGLIMEFIGIAISNRFDLARRMSAVMYRRLTAFVCTFGVQWSWISFFFFMTDKEHGYFLVTNLYDAPWLAIAIAMFGIYSWVQLSMELEVFLDPPRPKPAPVQYTPVPTPSESKKKK